MLTRKQQELLFFIHDSMKKNGISPSFDEMKTALDLASKSGIHRLIVALEERGFIRRLPNRARALEIIRLPQGIFAPPQNGRQFMPSVISSHKNESRADAVSRARGGNIRVLSEPVSFARVQKAESGAAADARRRGEGKMAESGTAVPLMGRMGAGAQVSTLQRQTGTLFCPADMLGKGEYYALEIKGDFMLNAGIVNNDIVIIQRAESAAQGEIIVALVDGVEMTLKRYRRRGNSVALEAANPAYETRIFGPGRVKIQGKLAGLLRYY